CRCAGTARSASPPCSWRPAWWPSPSRRRSWASASRRGSLARRARGGAGVSLDGPAGLVEARVAVRDGRARSVTLRNVASFLHARDRTVHAKGIGEVAYDMAFGGNFYAIVAAASAGVEVDPARADELVERGAAVMDAVNAADRPVHPEDERISGCRHVIFHAPARDGAHRRAATS